MPSIGRKRSNGGMKRSCFYSLLQSILFFHPFAPLSLSQQRNLCSSKELLLRYLCFVRYEKREKRDGDRRERDRGKREGWVGGWRICSHWGGNNDVIELSEKERERCRTDPERERLRKTRGCVERERSGGGDDDDVENGDRTEATGLEKKREGRSISFRIWR